MRFLPTTPHLLLCLGLLMVNAPSWAATCDELRAEIEGKIKAAGVSRFSVTVVDASSSAPGQVVGNCERGAKKIMYAREAVQPASPAASPAASSPASPAAPKPAPTASSNASAKAPAATPPASRPAPAPRRAGQPMITECADGSVIVGGDCKKK